MHNRKVLVFKNVNYGASKASATANTAFNPADLADGAVGVYGIHEAGSTNLNKLVLITNGGSESAGLVPMASFVGKEVFIAQGVPLTAGGSAVRMSNPISLSPISGMRKVAAKVYTAPVRDTIIVGYLSTVSGSSLNLPATINTGDDFIVSLIDKNYIISGQQEPGRKVLLSAQAKAGWTPYQVLSNFVAQQNARYVAAPIADNILIDITKLQIQSNASGSAFTNSATAAVTNGSTAVTTSAAHGVTTNQWITLGGDLYQAVAASGSSITLDRPYQGVTNAALANNQTVNTASTTVPTQLALQFVGNADFLDLSAAVQGIAINSTITHTVFNSPGSGSNAEVVNLEKEALGKKGTEDQIIRYQPLDIVYSQVAGSTYDLYFFETRQATQARGEQGSVFGILNYIICAFVSGIADTGGFNQADFENVMQTLFPTPAIPSIS